MPAIWLPDYSPASPSASDDEFDNASLAVAWTEWDVPNNLTVSEDDAGLNLVQTSSNGNKLTGVFCALPSGDFAIWTKVSLISKETTYGNAGIFLSADLTNNPSTSDLVAVGVWFYGMDYRIHSNLLTQYDTYSTDYGYISDDEGPQTVYLRIRRATTTLYFDWSSDGIGWLQVGTVAQPFTPAEMGLFINANQVSTSARAVFSFFRYVAGTPALTDVMGGQRYDPDTWSDVTGSPWYAYAQQ